MNGKKLLKSLIVVLLPILFGVFILIQWENGSVHELLHLRKYMLPLPSEIKSSIINDWDLYFINTITTVKEALFGLLIGSTLGYVVALIASIFPKYGKGGIVVVTGLNAVPLIAWMPIMNNWFGIGSSSKTAVAAMCCIPVMAINCFRGMTEYKPFALDLMSINNATKLQVFFKLQVPNSLPYVMTALKINTTTSILAAVLSETFSSYSGIGFQMSSMLKTLKLASAWGYICMASLVGIVLYVGVLFAERLLIFWHESQRNK